MLAPARPKVYHITRVENLTGIVAAGGLLSDREMIARQGPAVSIGMSSIKAARLQLPVHCHPGTFVGDYVPFYFCPRSIMLYMLHRGNHPELAYHEGQAAIVHLELDLHEVIAVAGANAIRWAFTLSNAAGRYAQFHSNTADLRLINWAAVAATDFRDAQVKEGKQAELLVHGFVPWHLIARIGVRSADVATRTGSLIPSTAHRPIVEVVPGWYY